MRNGQNPDQHPFEIRTSTIQGRGAFATRRIQRGDRIAEYTGERITWKEADRRYDDAAMGRHHTFLFALTRRTVIDAAVGGNDSRLINHSCAPNSEATIEDGRIYIEALRDIRPGEELTYDYAFERDANTTDEDERLYACRCGAANCRGTILVAPDDRVSRVSRVHHAASRHATKPRRKSAQRT